MNLPFSPTFFRKMDIFQQLMEYENQAKDKRLWKGEKAVLIWGASDKHQLLDEGLNWRHVKKALDYCVKKKFITESEKNELSKPALRTHIIRTFPVREFGDLLDKDDSRVRINRNGILAGKILAETNNLKNTRDYRMWTGDWHLLYYLAGLLLVIQVLKGFVELVKLFF